MSRRHRRENGLAAIRGRIRRAWHDVSVRSHVGNRARWVCRVLGAAAVVALAVFTDLPALSVVFLGLLVTAGALWVVDLWLENASTRW